MPAHNKHTTPRGTLQWPINNASTTPAGPSKAAALVVYLVLMKGWILRRYPQQELVSDFDDRFLATSVGRNWVYTEQGRFERLNTDDIPTSALKREDR